MNDDMLGLPPHSVEAEQAVLGGLMLQNDALDRIADLIRAEDFYRADHRAIFAEITRQIGAGKAADYMTVAEALDSAGRLAEVGGWPYLHDLTANTPSAANIRRYAEAVRDRARLRALATVGAEMAEAAYTPDGRTAAEIAAHFAPDMDAIAEDSYQTESVTADQAVIEVIRMADDGTGRGGLMTGFEGLDSLTGGGLEPGQLFIIAARPAVGKTAAALSMTSHVSAGGHRVGFFSLEMSRRELAARLLAALSGVDGRALKAGPTEADWLQLTRAAAAPGLANLILDDKPAASVAYVRARARRLRRAGGLALVIVDYLQLMTPADPRASRTEQVGGLSRGLKALAKELGLPVIALAQLNRASENRADRRPQLSDLRDSGEIEQDADMVLLLHKADGVLECNLAKHRQGPTGVFYVDFHAPTMTFTRRYGPPPAAPDKPKRGGFND